MSFFSNVPPALWVAAFLALYMAWAIGANDVANAMGTSVGSGALTVWGAILVAGIFEFCGAFFAGGHVTDTVRKGMLDLGMISRDQLVYGMLASLASAGTLLIGATRFGLPVSTTHSIVGAIVGFGTVAIGFDAVNWGKIMQIVLSWLTSPLLAGVIAFFIFQITRSKVQRALCSQDPCPVPHAPRPPAVLLSWRHHWSHGRKQLRKPSESGELRKYVRLG